jgi:acetyl-CoA decarbonylase/synthase complex subunit gamma
MRYRVEPGLYALGNPGDGSPVLVTANYRLSFNCVRGAMAGHDAWILVLDTKGINVWCAAGKGTLGTAELINRINKTGIAGVVKHRTLILPQLGAPGVAAHDVTKATAFKVLYGPVRANDIPEYLAAGNKATPAMRAVSFTLRQRTVLTPMEFFPALNKYLWVAFGWFTFMGILPDGIYYRIALAHSWSIIAAGLLAVLAGAIVTPILLPVIPFRSFAAKGALAGAVLLLPLFFFKEHYFLGSTTLSAGALLFFIAISSYLALNFTGCTPFTNMSGVKKEMRFAVPAYFAACGISLVLLVGYKLQEWGVL